MIGIENLKKSFGSDILFDGISFKVNPRERIGLTGRNGEGKTTLFRIIVGEEQPESGVVVIPKNYRIGYVRQQIDFKEDTVLKEAAAGLPEGERDHYWKVEKILGGLGFSAKDMQRHPGEFSGGFQVRLNLAKILLSEPDMLLLDEPTNYLDITSIRWIQQFLLNWPHEMMLITHDRSLMDKLVTHVIGIHRKKIKKIRGNTEKYYAQISQEEEIYEKTRLNDERKQKEVNQFITRFRAKARLANLVQSRIKTLKKMEKSEKLAPLETLDFSFPCKPFNGRWMLTVRDISFAYRKQRPLIKNLSFSLCSGERIFIIGKNGKGKTTLLKLLSRTLSTQGGEIKYHPAAGMGVFEQTNIKNLVDSRTLEEEILYSHPGVNRQMARNICGAMMFRGDEAEKKIGVLSGGEKSRVMLGKLLVTPLNLLLLDEPTNHLDMETCDSFLAAIDSFEGTVIMVTHNEMFLHALARRLIVFEEDKVSLFEGSYQHFLDRGGWQDDDTLQKNNLENDLENDDQKALPPKLTKKQFRQKRSEFTARRSKLLKPVEQRIIKVENEIEENENRLNALDDAMAKASLNHDGKKIGKIAQSMHTRRTDIELLFNDLEELTDKFEKHKADFEREFEELEQEGNV